MTGISRTPIRSPQVFSVISAIILAVKGIDAEFISSTQSDMEIRNQLPMRVPLWGARIMAFDIDDLLTQSKVGFSVGGAERKDRILSLQERRCLVDRL